MSLTTFKSGWIWVSYLYTCLLEWFLCIPPGLPVHTSNSYHFLFMLGSGAAYSSCRPPATFASFHTCQDGPFLSLQEENSEYQPALVDMSFLQGCIPWHSTKQDPEQAKSALLKSRVVILLFCLAHFSQDPELYHLMIAVAMAALTSSSLTVRTGCS